MLSFENKTIKKKSGVFCLSYPKLEGEEYPILTEYFSSLGEMMRYGIENRVGDEILGCCQGRLVGYCFVDPTCFNEKFFSALIVYLVYSAGEVVYFKCMPVCLDSVSGMHCHPGSIKLDKWENSSTEKNIKGSKKLKNIPYCVMGNTVYRVENCYSGERIKLRRRNYRSLLSFTPIGVIT